MTHSGELPTLDAEYLPDMPNEWSADVGGFKQRWLPGAFGQRENIADVWAYKVEDDEWTGDSTSGIFRTIKKAKVVELADTARKRGELA